MRYFGYGSNLRLSDLARWCREHGHPASCLRPVSRAWLPDRAPVFHYYSVVRRGGALDTRPRFGAAVPGVLFDLAPGGVALLDAKEGVAQGKYRRIEVTALGEHGGSETAFTYEVAPAHREDALVAPNATYLHHVREGLRGFGLPTGSLEAAAAGRPIPALPRAVFVYGTLRRGESRASVMARHAASRPVPAQVSGVLHDFRHYPGLVPSAPGTVHGELVDCRDVAAALEELDAIEEFFGYRHPESEYHRSIVRCRTVRGARLAWTYTYAMPIERAPVIASGDWTHR